RRLAEAEVGPEARGAEAPSTPHQRVHLAVSSTRAGKHEPDPRPDSEPVGGLAYQLQLHPVIAVPRVLVERGPEPVTRVHPARHLDHVLVAGLVDVAEGDRVALLEIPEATRGRDVLESFPLVVSEHSI